MLLILIFVRNATVVRGTQSTLVSSKKSIVLNEHAQGGSPFGQPENLQIFECM